MTQIQTFGMLGIEFQIKLISQIIYDRNFGITITPIMEVKYFDDAGCKLIVSIIKNYNQKYPNKIPTKSGLKELILADNSIAEQNKVYTINILKELESKSVLDAENTQEMALNFCKQQEMLKAISEVMKIVNQGDFHAYPMIDKIIQKAQEKGVRDDNSVEVDYDLDSVLEEDYRNPIPTGIEGLDNEIRGGLAKGELGMLIMPTGTGKSTLLSKFANTAYKKGYNVLQIFFEDKTKDIQRKHCSSLTHIPLNDLHMHKQVVKDALEQVRVANGKLILKKYPSDSTTVNHIKQQLRLLRNKGITIDMLIVDYVDCLTTNRSEEDALVGEGAVIRQLEALCDEEDIALWTAVQSNRSGAGTDVVEVNMIQGSFKRAQVGHLIISVGKTQEQKQEGLATMTILKSRFGGDGKIFKNMTFQNDTMFFDTTEKTLLSTMALGNEDNAQSIEAQKQQKAFEAMKEIQRQKEAAKLAKEKDEELKKANNVKVNSDNQTDA